MITKEQADNFKKEIKKLCQLHGISISHQDEHGAFLLTEYDADYAKWFDNALRFDYETNQEKDDYPLFPEE